MCWYGYGYSHAMMNVPVASWGWYKWKTWLCVIPLALLGPLLPLLHWWLDRR
jgi:hypothetical protein